MAADYILSIDQGTTSTRALLFDRSGSPMRVRQKDLRQIFPQDGWVEHDAAEIWAATLEVCRGLLTAGTTAGNVAAIGITNQRETTVLWERATGKPLHNAIVWQDRRTAQLCAKLKAEGKEPVVQAKTGLLLDPYFSGTKLAWLLDRVEGARERAKKGELCFGTIDSWLIFNLTGRKVHATDATNASRTLLFNIETQDWDDELLGWFDIPREILPEVKDCCADFGVTEKELFGIEIPVAGVAGDQQAATVGQACFEPGLIKSTYGTGCFAVVNTGERRVESRNRLLGTVAYRIGGKTTYALEGSIFMAGAIVQWLRDEMGLVAKSEDSEAMARDANPNSHAVLVPAFTGLGAPYWEPDARAALFGMTRDTGAKEIVRAALESVSYQTRDLMDAMAADMKAAGLKSPQALRVDGGMVANNWFAQNLADILARPVERPEITETTALGAAYLAGMHVGFYGDMSDVAAHWRCERAFSPKMAEAERAERYERWRGCVKRVIG
ncbi:glycerol kinase [Parvibaculum lavamentivorans DS-1]|uniref:Glycerol kinase n=1 Tax=Parvibaculum lavamentivorans (strain DS-1 / DSM 13023 / NCIMB 13966) TaxID=402881 RepID=A7HWM9_PARL1|nr:glycerol kinase GlpK [Parvibaculum lavamentivorans]ABS64312.1 glycerol kinase [Parvibaculum lavamentivorans DS-1]